MGQIGELLSQNCELSPETIASRSEMTGEEKRSRLDGTNVKIPLSVQLKEGAWMKRGAIY